MGMASVNKQHEELFDAYKLDVWKNPAIYMFPISQAVDFQHWRSGGYGRESGDYG